MIENTVLPNVLAFMMGKFGTSGATITVEGTTVLLFWVDTQGRHLTRARLECWPDTIDPRGPKGK